MLRTEMLCHQIYNLMFLVTLLGQVCHSLQVEGDFFTEIYENVTVSAEEDVFLECLIFNPTFIDWQKDGKAIEVSNAYAEKRVYIMKGEGLLILNADYNDRGQYLCFGVQKSTNMMVQKTINLDVAPSSDDVRPLRSYPIECGIPRLRGKVVGGKTTEVGQAPWMALLWNKKENKHFCGGVLLSKRWVLTAAHCFVRFDYDIKEYMEVRLGEYDIFQEEGSERILQVEQIIVHPEYDKDTFDSDITLLKLRQPVTYTDFIVPICLPSEIRAMNLLRAHTRGYITGWGRTAEITHTTTRYLRRVRLLVMDQQTCNTRHRDIITNRMFCAVSDERPMVRDSCFGDSGSPFAVRDNKRWYLVGLVSWGIGCARHRIPGVYTRVHRFTQWINNLIGDDTDTCAGLQERLSEMTSQLSTQDREIKRLKELLKEKNAQHNETSTTNSSQSPDLEDTSDLLTPDPTRPPLNSRQSTPPHELRNPCIQGSCEHVGGYHVSAVCEDDFCSCESPYYSRATCLPRYGSCVIKHDAPTAIAMPSFQDEPQMTYSCLADDNSLCRVHVLAVYEGNRHTIPPTAGDMEVMVEGQRSADERRGVVLVLVSFEPVNWNVHLVGQSMIERVILISLHNSTVAIKTQDNNTQSDITIVSLTGPRGYGNDSGVAGDTAGMLGIINQTVGPVTSFTGTYRAERWILNVDASSDLTDTS
ncbi:uncharacterized protein LOC117291111 isoform X1 [Asterias rubens]|uniref:uncharacterized protein LOC117291111 isoform X1 n=1 Tax=Asterias rubens TaxID=7604 RepID=UPI00145565AB|nr:uncharacterized protein LOC117291111 isoform X1 [Asterias rubens]